MIQLSHKGVKTIKLFFHIGFIAVIVFRFLEKAFYRLPDQWLFFLTSDAVENFICAFIAYLLYHFVLKLTSIWKKVGWLILFVTILLLEASLKEYRIFTSITFQQIFGYFTSFLGQSLLFYLLIYFINRLDFLNKYITLEKELQHAQEQLLRNQLHPHFLFNAFNSLYSLSLKNHPDTPDYILKLSSMMRYLTDETNLKKVPLVKEVDFIKKYIAIEEIRFGKDARITFDIKNITNDDYVIEPYLLITLVENAFKHGFYTNSKDAFVKIKMDIIHKELQFTVENSLFDKQHFQENHREGKGLKNLKQRLQLLYPKSSSINITTTEKTYMTQLKLILL